MIKSGEACSQLMEANNTGETNIKVVRNIFRLTFVFNALKTYLNLCLISPISLKLFLTFAIRGVLSIKTCLEGGNLVNLTIHAPWCIMGCPPNIFYQTTCKVQAWGQPRLGFAEHHGCMWGKGAWRWLKVKTSSGRSNNASKGVDENVWKVHTVAKQQSKHQCAREEPSQ
jgi:hypothetical protein